MAGVCKENNTAKNIDGVGVGSGEGRWVGRVGVGVGSPGSMEMERPKSGSYIPSEGGGGILQLVI